jgi:hypothetical protein
MTSSALGGAEVTMIVEKTGRVRAMNMAPVWAKGRSVYFSASPTATNWYDNSGFAEGAYPQFVDDELMQEWQ